MIPKQTDTGFLRCKELRYGVVGKREQSLHAIGRALGKNTCGYLPSVEAPWWDCAAASAAVHRVHSPWQNEKTSPAESLAAASIRGIAQGLHRGASTISREVARHGGRAQYRANEADQQAWKSALRPKPCLLATTPQAREIVASKLDAELVAASKFPDG